MDSLYVSKKQIKRINRKTFIKVVKPVFQPKRPQKLEFANYLETKSKGDSMKKPIETKKTNEQLSFVKLYFEACTGDHYRYMFRNKLDSITDESMFPYEFSSTRIKSFLENQSGKRQSRHSMPCVSSEVILELDYDNAKN